MSDRIQLLDRAQRAIAPELVALVRRELKKVFPRDHVTVRECFRGFRDDQRRRLILGVEVKSKEDYDSHVVKLGNRNEVGTDFAGWNNCVRKANFSSRIFLPVRSQLLPNDRQAVIYEDAYTFVDDEDGRLLDLESACFDAVDGRVPDPESIERVIRQVYADMHRGFYRNCRLANSLAKKFYARRLRSALPKWQSQDWRRGLRRNLNWLLGKNLDPSSRDLMGYYDPYDYLVWVFEQPESRLPATLVGTGHGDLHARNVLVSLRRGEAEYPTVIDYGEMGSSNALVWDFVKLETELKVRLLSHLFRSEAVREHLCGNFQKRPIGDVLSSAKSGCSAAASLDLERLAFGYEFEQLMAYLTRKLYVEHEPTFPRKIEATNIPELDKTLSILMRIREEAAYYLGERQLRRGRRVAWRDEYYFGLAAYGVHSAKFEDYEHKRFLSTFALLSAGVAVANIESLKSELQRQYSLSRISRISSPSYQIPLFHAHAKWTTGRGKQILRGATEMLKMAVEKHSTAMGLRQELALLLVETGAHDEALALLEPTHELCKSFCDFESLCRIGRTYKSLGDKSLEKNPVPASKLSSHPAWQFYGSALLRYKEAFDVSNNYYPGINVATLAVLRGDHGTAKQYARNVAQICESIQLASLSRMEQAWLLATEGESRLIEEKIAESDSFYSQALESLHTDESRVAQSMYDQLCRLSWALGISPSAFERRARKMGFQLKPGPLLELVQAERSTLPVGRVVRHRQ